MEPSLKSFIGEVRGNVQGETGPGLQARPLRICANIQNAHTHTSLAQRVYLSHSAANKPCDASSAHSINAY